MHPLLFMVLLGLVLGLIIGLAAHFFTVTHDPRIEEVEEMLPGTNCGACGFAGCFDMARALVNGEATPDMCPASPPENVQSIAGFLGITTSERISEKAVVRCGGDRSSTWTGEYNGVLDCQSANLVAGGGKGCNYGCLGLGTCARVCPFGAIGMREGLAIVHPEICTGCRKCVSVCPRNLITMVPADAPLHVYCNSPEKAVEKKKVCSVSCIGCRKCYKEAGPEKIEMDGFLARVKYDNPPEAELADVCPTGCLKAPSSLAEEKKTESREQKRETASIQTTA